MIGAGEYVHELLRLLHACAASDQYFPGWEGKLREDEDVFPLLSLSQLLAKWQTRWL